MREIIVDHPAQSNCIHFASVSVNELNRTAQNDRVGNPHPALCDVSTTGCMVLLQVLTRFCFRIFRQDLPAMNRSFFLIVWFLYSFCMVGFVWYAVFVFLLNESEINLNVISTSLI